MIKYSVIRRGVNIEKNIRFWNQTDLDLNCKLETYQLCERQVAYFSISQLSTLLNGIIISTDEELWEILNYNSCST